MKFYFWIQHFCNNPSSSISVAIWKWNANSQNISDESLSLKLAPQSMNVELLRCNAELLSISVAV
jgi:hypothetical protein